MKSQFLALVPSIVFLVTFALLNLIYCTNPIDGENFSIFATFIALIFAMFTFQNHETFNERIEIFIKGSSKSIVVHMCYIFFLSTIFTTILEKTGSITSAVNVCLHVVPTWFILPGIFIGASFFTFTIGSSLGAIAAFMPVALTMAEHIGLDPSLMASTIICGSVCGDNLSILSDSSILSVKVTGTTMIKKFCLNLKIVLPAFISTVILLTYQNSLIQGCNHVHNIYNINFFDIIKALPYTITFCLALTGLDIIAVIILGIIAAITIGLYFKNFTVLTAINLTFDGFYHAKDMVNLFILVVLLSGLAAIITHNGGIAYLIDKLKYKITNTRHAQFAIFCWIALINIMIAINSIAIVIAGPATKKIAHECDIDSAQAACILNIVSCALQGILPYAPQLVLAASIARVSTLSLLPYLYYQFFLLASLLIVIVWNPKHCKLKSACLKH